MSRLGTGMRCAALAVVMALGVGCGGDDDGLFDEHVAVAREAVEAGDPAAATAALDALALRAVAAHEEGAISDAELDEVVQRTDASRELLAPETTTTTTTTTAPPPPETTAPPAPEESDDDEDDDENGEGEDDEGKGEDRGKGKGKGNDKKDD